MNLEFLMDQMLRLEFELEVKVEEHKKQQHKIKRKNKEPKQEVEKIPRMYVTAPSVAISLAFAMAREQKGPRWWRSEMWMAGAEGVVFYVGDLSWKCLNSFSDPHSADLCQISGSGICYWVDFYVGDLS